MNVIESHADLVFEGGGVKGSGSRGARDARGARVPPQNIAGTSAGAITAALLAAGYTAAELREIIISLDYRQFRTGLGGQGAARRALAEPAARPRPLRGRPLPLVDPERLEAKGVRTFADLVQDEFADDPALPRACR